MVRSTSRQCSIATNYLGESAARSSNKSHSVCQCPLLIHASTGYLHVPSTDHVEAPLECPPDLLDQCINPSPVANDTSIDDFSGPKTWNYSTGHGGPHQRSPKCARRMSSYREEVLGTHPPFSPSTEVAASVRWAGAHRRTRPSVPRGRRRAVRHSVHTLWYSESTHSPIRCQHRISGWPSRM